MQALLDEPAATLSTCGPSGVQAGFFPCEAEGLKLYLLIPTASDILFNLESEAGVVVTTARWQLEGDALCLEPSVASPALALARLPRAAGCAIVAVRGRRIHFSWTEDHGYRETFDL